MAKKKASALLKSAKIFINENDEAIEKDVYANADTIEVEANAKQGYIRKSHEAICEALGLESVEDSKYFDYDVFKKMLGQKVRLRRERREKAEAKKREAESKEEG